MKQFSLFITVILVLSVCVSSFSQEMTGLKKRVAIINFEDRSGYGHNIGQGVADMLVTALVESDKFIVIEREELDEVLKEP